jgi:hypothetical protein
VPGSVLPGVPGDVFLDAAGDVLPELDLSPVLTPGLLGDLGERAFGVPFNASGEDVLDARPLVRLEASVSCASCFSGVVTSGDLASSLLTACGVTADAGDLRPLIGVEGGG